MKGPRVIFLLGGFLLLTSVASGQAPLADYFAAKVAQVEKGPNPLASINTAERWKAERPELQRRLREMMGLDPMPPRSALNPTITATIERSDFIVEKLHYESSPGLHVTANLFRPKSVTGRLPAILYVCGHGEEKKNGVIFGNKAHYNHHAAWYAANGYVCLIVDTLQLGEVPGLHHGTYRDGMLWWWSRGYTPAGIETWNGIRGIDYLVSRRDVDPSRIGVTGRSGGGATSWWLGALDDRVAAVVPVAGITDLRNHVIDGCVQGHCDCMYFVNTYRWDYDTLAALCAPKPMLVQNTDRDPIFPEDGVRHIHQALQRVYSWYGASDRLGLQIGSGGHADTVELRHPSFAFFEKWLKQKDDAIISEPDRKLPVESLRVLPPTEDLASSKNATIHETFVAPAKAPEPPKTADDWSRMRTAWLSEIQEKVFGGWPPKTEKPEIEHRRGPNGELEASIASEPGVEVVVVFPVGMDRVPAKVRMEVQRPGPFEAKGEKAEPTLIIRPRGVGTTAWPAARDLQVRRRFYLLGETLDGQRVWDVIFACRTLRAQPGMEYTKITLVGRGEMATVALWAAAFEPGIATVELIDPPATVRDGPAFLNIERILGMPQALALLHPRPVTLLGKVSPVDWQWAIETAENVAPGKSWLTIRPTGLEKQDKGD